RVDPQNLGVFGIECVFRIDERRDAALVLCVRHRMQCNRCFPAALRPEYLHDPAPWQPTGAKRDIECDGTGGDRADSGLGRITEAHHGALAVLLVDLRESEFESLVLVGTVGLGLVLVLVLVRRRHEVHLVVRSLCYPSCRCLPDRNPTLPTGADKSSTVRRDCGTSRTMCTTF